MKVTVRAREGAIELADVVEALQRIKPVMSVEEFCERHGITKPTYYKMRAIGREPRTIQIGRRRLITVEAAADWRREAERTPLIFDDE